MSMQRPMQRHDVACDSVRTSCRFITYLYEKYHYLTSYFPTQKYNFLYHASSVFRITIRAYAGSL